MTYCGCDLAGESSFLGVTSFCEWSGGKSSKQEHWFSVPAAPIFSFAGIWRPTVEGNCYAFITCDPKPLVEPIHPKAMPVIVHEEDYEHLARRPGGECLRAGGSVSLAHDDGGLGLLDDCYAPIANGEAPWRCSQSRCSFSQRGYVG